MPAKVSESARAIGHRRIGERGRRGEPIGRRDVEADSVRERPRASARTQPRIVSTSPKVATNSREPLARPRSHRAPRSAISGSSNIDVRGQHADDAADDLRGDVDGRDARPGSSPAQCEGHADGRIEVRARHRAERQDQHGENRAGRQRVAEQRERAISARELRGHDPRADDGREQERGAQALRARRRAQRRLDRYVTRWPISREPVLQASACRESGSAVT